jgi:adenylate cyclase 2
MPMLVLVAMTVTSLGVFAAGQSACLLRSDLTALGVSLVVTGVLGAGIIALGWPTAPLPLFALLLAVHTMMPVSRIVSLTLAAVLTIAHIVLAVTWRLESQDYLEVRCIKHIYIDMLGVTRRAYGLSISFSFLNVPENGIMLLLCL